MKSSSIELVDFNQTSSFLRTFSSIKRNEVFEIR